MDNNGNFDPRAPDIYYQIIGVEGAKQLDKTEGVTTRIDNLRNAQDWEAKGMPTFALWRNYGWMRGADGEWRTEILDDDIYEDFLFNTKRRTVELQDVYDCDALYIAYPDLAYMPVRVQKL